MPSERRFRDDGTKATRFYQPNDGDDRMKENDEEVVHAGIVSKSQNLLEFRPILEFATDTMQFIRDSAHQRPEDQIQRLDLQAAYEVQKAEIIGRRTRRALPFTACATIA
jgi:hypothetical protein